MNCTTTATGDKNDVKMYIDLLLIVRANIASTQ